MSGSEILERLVEHHEQLAAALSNDLDSHDAFPTGPDIAGLTSAGVELTDADRDRARQVLADLTSLQDRVAGLQTRIAGEIAGMRRTNVTAAKPAPRALDTSL